MAGGSWGRSYLAIGTHFSQALTVPCGGIGTSRGEWGRLIGVLFLLPFLWFLARRTISGALAVKLAGMFLLGGAQGVLGWYMVKSGLPTAPMSTPIA